MPPGDAAEIIFQIHRHHQNKFSYLCSLELEQGHVYLLRDRRTAQVYGVTSLQEFHALAKRHP